MSSKSVGEASLHRGAILHWTGWFVLVSGALALSLLAALGAAELALAMWVVVFLSLALLCVAVALLERFPPRLWPHCEISDEGGRLRVVELRGSRRYGKGKLSTRRLAGGLVLPKQGTWPAMVEIVSKSGSALRIIDGKGKAKEQWKNRWLRAHGLDAAHAPTRASLGSVTPWPLWAALIASPLGVASMFGLDAIASAVGQPWMVAIAIACAAVIAAIASGAARLLAPTAVTVGSDGVAIQHAFSSSFVPHADIEQVEFLGRAGLRIRIVGGRTLRAGWLLGVARRDALVALIDAWYQRADPLPEQLEALRRASRPVSEWIGALGNVFAAASYRSEAPTPAQVLSAIDNAAAPVELRIAAMVALVEAKLLDSDAAERLGACRATCASEPIAKAIDELAAGGIDAATVEAALAQGAAVESGVRTAQRALQSEPSPTARHDAGPEGGAVVKTHLDSFMLWIVGLPIFPLVIISFIGAVNDGETDTLIGMRVLSLLWLPYFVAWIVSRVRSERRFVFYPKRVWLPGFYFRLSGRFLTYQDIAHLGGDSEYFHIVLRNGKRRTYEGNVVDFGKLEKTFKRFGVASQR